MVACNMIIKSGKNGTFRGLIRRRMQDKLIPVYKSSLRIADEEDFFNMKWLDLNIESLEKIEAPHRHDYFSMYMLIAGETTQFIDFQEYTVQANALIMMRPEQIHFHVNASNAKLLQIKFREQFLIGLINRNNWLDIFNNDVIKLDKDTMAGFMRFVDLMDKENQEDFKSKEIVSKVFSALLDKISIHLKKIDSGESKRNKSIYKDFKRLLERNSLDEAKVSEYAKRLFVSAGHLNDVVKEVTGKNAKTIINEQRILEAKRLLYWTTTPIREVAYKTGFDDPTYFTRFFKKHTGMLPSEFQRKV